MGGILKGSKITWSWNGENLKPYIPASLLILVLVLALFTQSNLRTTYALTPVADLTGQWSGFGQFDEADGCRQTVKLNVNIEQHEDQLSGTYSFVSTGSQAIKPDIDCSNPWEPGGGTFEGTLDGSRISVTLSDDGLTYTGWYASSGIKLSVDSDWLKGTMQLAPTNFEPPPFHPKSQPAPEPKEEPTPPQQGEPEPTPVPPEEEPPQNEPTEADDAAQLDKAIGDSETTPISPDDWSEGVPIEGETPQPLRSQTDENGSPILQDHKIGEIKVGKGSVTITDTDGNIITSNEIKLGQTIQTGTNSDTNIKIGLENGGSINLQENTKLGTVPINLPTDEDIAEMEQNQKIFEQSVMDDINKRLEKKSVTLSDEDIAEMEQNQKNFEKSVMDDINKRLEKKSTIQQVDEKLSRFFDNIGLNEKEVYLAGHAFNVGLLLGLTTINPVGGALVTAGYVVITGGIYFDFISPQSQNKENQNKVIFTRNAALFPQGTTFTVAVEGMETKLDVLNGKVYVVPYDTSLPIKVVNSGNSILVSDNKVEKTILNLNSLDKWWEKSLQTQPSKGGCLIATAAYGTELAPQIQQLRETRDRVMYHTESGTTFMTAFNTIYYAFSPTVADWERENPLFKEAVKVTITPMITTLSILNHIPIHSESELLVYGIAIILLNIGMYFVVPAFAIIRLKRLVKYHENS